MARDRQRAKQRRRRQEAGGAAARSAARTKKARDVGLDDATVDDAGLGGATPAPETPAPETPAPERDSEPADGTPVPDPLDHASADVDQAKLAEQGAVPPEVGDADNEYEGAYDDFDDADRAPDEAEDDAAVVSADPDVHERPRKQGGRVLTFLRHCADELRRVQWPNRRQVGQATAVVLGFVVLAGGYLGLLDALWKPIIDAIL